MDIDTINGCKYRYCNAPTKNSIDWHQYLSFECCPHAATKEDLLKKRAAIIHDISCVFTKYGLKLTNFSI